MESTKMESPSPATKRWFIGGTVVVGIILVIILIVVLKIPKRDECPADIPKCDKGKVYFYANETSSHEAACFDLDSQQPGLCPGKNMAVVKDYKCRSHGVCDCDTRSHNRTLIYDNKTNECYFIYEQGYCEPENYLTLAEVMENGRVVIRPLCMPDICWEKKLQDNSKTWVPFRNACHELYTYVNYTDCNEALRFYKNFKEPYCKVPTSNGGPQVASVGSVGAAPCPAGSKQAYHGGCQGVVDIDFL